MYFFANTTTQCLIVKTVPGNVPNSSGVAETRLSQLQKKKNVLLIMLTQKSTGTNKPCEIGIRTFASFSFPTYLYQTLNAFDILEKSSKFQVLKQQTGGSQRMPARLP